MKQLINNFQEENRCDYTVSSKMKKVWNIQLNMAVALLELCNKYQLRIWGVSGTMLGAVRHQGFIPWDDDMDFVMPRSDYETLLAHAHEIPKPFFLQSAYSDDGYYRGHAQLRFDESSMVLPYEADKGCKFNQGIFVDIFNMDGVPEDEKELQRLISQRKHILNFLWCRRYPKMLFDLGRLRRFIQGAVFLNYRVFSSDKKLYSLMEKRFKKYPFDASDFNCSLQFEYAKRWTRRREWFNETIWVKFEETEIPIPKVYDEILKHEYGNYMQPVRGTATHGELIIDPDVSYRELLKGYETSYGALLKKFIKSLPQAINYKLKQGR